MLKLPLTQQCTFSETFINSSNFKISKKCRCSTLSGTLNLTMGIYKYLQASWKNHSYDAIKKERLILWRTEGALVKLERPTRLDRARALGYKSKQGIIVVRVTIKRRKRLRPSFKSGRRSKHRRRKKIVNKSYQSICEERAARHYKSLEVLNSYYVGKDGQHYWYEIILVDPNNPVIKSDKTLKWITEPQHRGRAFRGLTSSSKKSRGLRRKGKGAEKVRPSLRAHKRRLH